MQRTRILDVVLATPHFIWQHKMAICKLLMRNAEDKNPEDSEGMTPLDIAAVCGHRIIIEFIMIYLDDLGI